MKESAAGNEPEQGNGFEVPPEAPVQQSAAGQGAPQPAPGQGTPLPAVPRFRAALDEKVIAFLSFIPAYLYVFGFFESFDQYIADNTNTVNGLETSVFRWCFLLFVLMYVIFAEVLYREEKRSTESIVWLIGLLAAGLTAVFPLGKKLFGLEEVWEPWMKVFMAHAFAIYYALSRNRRLSEDRSSHLLPLDIVNGVFIIPFKRFILRIMTIVSAFRDAGRKQDKKSRGTAILFAILAFVAALILFVIAINLLSQADDNFGRMVRDFLDIFEIEWGKYILYFFFSLPVGAYVYGLLGGVKRETREQVQVRGQMLMRGIGHLRKVPSVLWIILTALFIAAYGVFFFLQGQYLFGAFTGTLPEGFSASRYARQGFFELCRVMAVNFVLLWLIVRTSRGNAADGESGAKAPVPAGTKIVSALLLLESMLFAVVAFSKLMLYIYRFGFTPLRLSSSWLVVVLFLACIAAAVSLFSGKKTMRLWMIVSGLLAVGLCFI